jgi:hypothetical protein
MSVNEKMTAIADAMREYGKMDNRLTLDDMAQAPALIHEQAYQQGEMDGYSAGEEAGFVVGKEQGEKDYWNAFWDMFQKNGTRTGYAYAFSEVFTDELFKPKYNLIPDNANQMFRYSYITNLKQLLEDAGITLDTSKARYLTQMLEYSTVTHMPTIDGTAAYLASATFSDTANLVYVEKFIVKEALTFPNCFARASVLAEIRFEGTIGNDIDIHWSPLSRASIESLISCLSSTTTGKKVTLNKNAVLAAFGTEAAWIEYIASKSNWTFTLS